MRSVCCVATAMVLVLGSGCGSAVLEDYELGDDSSLALEVSSSQGQTTKNSTEAVGAQEAAAPAWDAREFVKSVPANPAGAGDGLEKHRDWKVLDWANSAEAAAWKRSDTGSDVLLIVRLKGGSKDKVAIMRPAEMALAKQGSFRLDIYNATDRKIGVAFAVYASVDDVYSESTAKLAEPGWNHLEWDLGASTYKTEASGWQNSTALWGGDQVRGLVILFYDPGKGSIAVDKLELDTVPKAPEAEPTT